MKIIILSIILIIAYLAVIYSILKEEKKGKKNERKLYNKRYEYPRHK